LRSFIGKRIGNQLLLYAFIKAKNLNYKQVTLLADVHAVLFYESKGFVKVGKKKALLLVVFCLYCKKI
jgi:predicted GNAT family N-acyltransferase